MNSGYDRIPPPRNGYISLYLIYLLLSIYLPIYLIIHLSLSHYLSPPEPFSFYEG